MARIRRMRHQRGALEGLPLYLIILIVVAAIVVAILVGWLSTLQHPGIQTVAFTVAGNGDQVLTEANYPSCVTSSDTACFTQTSGGGDCTFTVNTFAGSSGPLVVTVDDKSGAGLSGASVQLSGSGIQLNAQPSLTVTTGQNGAPAGEAIWTSLSGTIPAGDGSGGSISISVTYSSGGVSTTGAGQINVEPPTYDSATNTNIVC